MTARTPRRWSWRSGTAAAVLVTLAFPVTSCATNPVTGKSEFTLMSESEEIRVGQETDKELRAEMGVYDDPALQQYVTDVGMRLAASGQRPSLPWHFAVVDVPDVNAFALPGGYVYITRGLMAYLDTEAEMAGVLGHEIGHVNARHAAQGYTRSVTLMAGAVLTSVAVSQGRALRDGHRRGAQHPVPEGTTATRNCRPTASARRYSAKVGWTPMGMEGVLQALSRLEAAPTGADSELAVHAPAER